MDDSGRRQLPVMSEVQVPNLAMPYQANQMMGSTAPVSSWQLTTAFQAQFTQHRLSYQHIHKQQLQQLDQTLQMFWVSQYQEILATIDFKNHSLPWARIKKIMKADEDVRMIAAEAPVLFSRACEMFILELTYRSWAYAQENKRRTLQKNDIAGAVTRTDVFDFLVDIVPGEDLNEQVNANDSLSYDHVPPHVGTLGIIMSKPEVDQGLLYAQQPQSYMPQQFWQQQQTTQEQQPGEDS
ncbi:nuclear transcription factor Y subunit C-3-like [Elaeis guineensis]|uniref:Nuclear transcription factor Y subunit C-3-like n=1 Tax=Elaeis guineensis var. tenera TaxID=51953 RepID=A0A6J0PGU1_ELAGV|nr:nuclear transcription factor Y subunit C-3-like [Elaeis guineensis]